jgi:hypothetical protein
MPVLRRAVESLPGKLRMENSRVLAVPRVKLLKTLIAAIEDEAGQMLC